MGSVNRRWVLAVLAIAAAIGSACDSDSGRRFSPSNVPRSTRVVGRSIDGPPTVPPGGTAQFSLLEHLSDGSSRPVSGEVAWASSDESVLSVSPTGTATGRNRGEASISGSSSGIVSVKPAVMVMPPGTFRLEGAVHHAGFPVSGVVVTVVGGEGKGQSSSPDFDGRYRLYGVAGTIDLRATAPGYVTVTDRITVTENQSHNLSLTPSGPSERLSGRYTLTITAATSCAAQLPEQARVRTYTAMVTQDGPGLRVKLEDAQFHTHNQKTFNYFTGIVQANRVVFQLFDPYYYYYRFPAIIERLAAPASHLLSIEGTALTMGSGRVRSGSLNGKLTFRTQSQSPVATCESADHQFALSR